MATTHIDVIAPQGDWLNVNSALSIAAGKDLQVQPKGGNVLAAISTAKPTADSIGKELVSRTIYNVTGQDPLWIKAVSHSCALDADVGGYDAFEQQDEYTGRYVYYCNVADDYADAISILMQNPAALHASVERDFAARFPDVQAPTLADIAALCAALEVQACADC